MDSRYEVVAPLGQGGQGRVLLVKDNRLDGRLVALKRVVGPQNAGVVRQEFSLLSHLRHPSLARAIDFGEDEQGAYFTSEYVEGPDILTWAKRAPLPEVCEGLASVLRALALLHDRGLVHGDLSPANILVPSEAGARPRLLDLGAARAPGEQAVAATPGYAAPEVLSGRGLLPASDLYAFGALVSECLLGGPAFGSADASAIVARQLAGELCLPGDGESEVATLARELLSLDPADRPPTALVVLERLSRAVGLPLAATLREIPPAELPSPRLVGREEQLNLIAGSLQRIDDADSSRVLCLVGPKGSGRSSVLSAAVRRAQLDGLAVLGRPGTPPSVGELLRGLLEVSSGSPLLKASARTALERWLLVGAEGAAAPSSLALAAAEALAAASAIRPVLVVLDDLGEASSLAQSLSTVLARALDPERFGGRPRAVIIAARVLEDRAELPWSRDLVLGPLTRGGIADAVASMLPGLVVDTALVDNVFLLSHGWPGAAEALVRVAAQRNGDLSGLANGAEAALEPREQEVLRVLAAVGTPVCASLCRSVFGTDLIDGLSARGFLAEVNTDSGVELRPVGLVEAPKQEAKSEGFATAAQPLIEALTAQGKGGGAARLLAACGRDAEAVELYVAQALDERQQLDFTASAQWFDEALALRSGDRTPWIAAAVEVYRRLSRHVDALALVDELPWAESDRRALHVELLLDSGRHREALELGEAALSEKAGSAPVCAAVAAALVHMGRSEQALGVAREALAEWSNSGAEATSISGRLALVAALACTSLGRLDDASRLLARAARDFEAAADKLGQLKVVAALGQVSWRRGAIGEARSAFDRAVALSEEIGDSGRKTLNLNNRATMAQEQDDFAGALTDYRAALDLATLVGNEALRASIEVNLADLLGELGELKQAERLATTAMERSRSTRQERVELQALLARGKALLRRKDLVRAEAALREAVRRFGAAGEETYRLAAQLRLAELYLVRGDAEAAVALAQSISHRALACGRRREVAAALVLEGRARLACEGQAPRALALFEQAIREPLGEDAKWRLAWHMAAALEATGRSEAAVEHRAMARLGLSRGLERVPEGLRASFLQMEEAAEIEPRGRVENVTAVSDRWARDLELLMEVTRELTRELDPKRLLQLIMERAVELTGAERGLVILPKGGKLEPVVSHQIADEIEVSFSRQVAAKVVAEGRPTMAVDALDDERFRSFASVNTMKLRSILAVPLAIRRRVVGVIYLDSRLRSGVFTDADRRLLEAFGAQAAVALETARLVSENGRRLEELERANAEVVALSRRLEEKLEHKDSDLRRVGALLRQRQALRDEPELGIIGRSAVMQVVRRLVQRIATTDVSVYIYGPSGTGKELVARAIHGCSERAERPFVAVNCAALPAQLLSSELFGHVRGAFTGAMSDRKGLFELADGGVLLLDEVGDMDAEMQTHLLRVLQDGRFRKVGGSDELAVDVRILSASNKDLSAEVAAGRFREDLFYRLNVVRVDIPALRDRRDDIPLLVEFFLRKHSGKGALREMSRHALDLLLAADWPGNVRELENEVQRAIAMSTPGQPIEAMDLSERLRGHRVDAAPLGKGNLKARVDAFERVVIERVLGECRGNATLAAKTLGLSRAGLYKKLGKHQVVR